MYSEMLPDALTHTSALRGLHWYTDMQLMLTLQLWMPSKSQVQPAVRGKVEMLREGVWKCWRMKTFQDSSLSKGTDTGNAEIT